jgi:hypothetical protein
LISKQSAPAETSDRPIPSSKKLLEYEDFVLIFSSLINSSITHQIQVSEIDFGD